MSIQMSEPHPTFDKKPEACPDCGHSPLADILYGLPDGSDELKRDLKAGLITLGGCCVSVDDPAWECTKCEWLGWDSGVYEDE